MNETTQRQTRLPLAKAVKIAWKNIRIRWWRSMLVTSGIILAIAFLMYILSSDELTRAIIEKGSPELVKSLQKEGVLSIVDEQETRIQTWWMVGLALLISFVGILNAMVMSVTERFREIGTMKCLGALDSLIIKLYLLESMFQGMVGAMFGIMVGMGLALLESWVIYGGETWVVLPVAVLLKRLAACFLAGITLTIIGALYPAWVAAKMQPVDAMRTEV